jgi:cell division septation protein DedD
MPRTEDGEFELVLGNKQLLSVFFIIAILLGVFFTMGYIMGRNSAPMTALTPREASSAPAARQDAPSAMPQPGNSASANPPAQPGEGAAAPEAAEPPADTAKPGEPEAAEGGAAKVTQPQPGQTYVQVSSMLAQPEAEILVEVLGKKGFRAIIAPGPNEGRYRVLVGPVADSSDAGRVKADLEQAGFKGAFPKKY